MNLLEKTTYTQFYGRFIWSGSYFDGLFFSVGPVGLVFLGVEYGGSVFFFSVYVSVVRIWRTEEALSQNDGCKNIDIRQNFSLHNTNGFWVTPVCFLPKVVNLSVTLRMQRIRASITYLKIHRKRIPRKKDITVKNVKSMKQKRSSI